MDNFISSMNKWKDQIKDGKYNGPLDKAHIFDVQDASYVKHRIPCFAEPNTSFFYFLNEPKIEIKRIMTENWPNFRFVDDPSGATETVYEIREHQYMLPVVGSDQVKYYPPNCTQRNIVQHSNSGRLVIDNTTGKTYLRWCSWGCSFMHFYESSSVDNKKKWELLNTRWKRPFSYQHILDDASYGTLLCFLITAYDPAKDELINEILTFDDRQSAIHPSNIINNNDQLEDYFSVSTKLSDKIIRDVDFNLFAIKYTRQITFQQAKTLYIVGQLPIGLSLKEIIVQLQIDSNGKIDQCIKQLTSMAPEDPSAPSLLPYFQIMAHLWESELIYQTICQESVKTSLLLVLWKIIVEFIYDNTSWKETILKFSKNT